MYSVELFNTLKISEIYLTTTKENKFYICVSTGHILSGKTKFERLETMYVV